MAVAVGGAVLLTLSNDVPHTARLQDQVEALEDAQVKLTDENKRLERAASELSERLTVVEKRLALGVPGEARVVALQGGGTERWELPTGAAYVQFLRLEADVPVFTIKNAAGSAEVRMRAGESHVAVDDRGSELRVHTTTLHRIRRNRNGTPAEALFSAEFELRTP